MDILELHDRALDQVGEIIDNVKPDQLEAKTPCPDWSLRELLAHIINGNIQWSPDGGGPFASVGLPDDIDAVLGDDFASAYDDSAELNSKAWNRSGVINRSFDTPPGPIRASERIKAHMAELLSHGWDVAKSTHQVPHFDDEVVGVTMDYAQENMPAERDGKFFGNVQKTGDDAQPIDRLVAFMGRAV